MTTKEKPIIGIILDWEGEGSFSDFPYYALRTHYVDAVRLAGGNPWLIPYGDIDAVEGYVQALDGLLVPGGFYAMPDQWYEDKEIKSPYLHTPRLEFEMTMLKSALDLDLAVLGICGGMQVLGGILGCKFTGNVAEYFNGQIEHFDLAQDHQVNLALDSLLYQLIGAEVISTNSHHREAIISVSDQVKISGHSLDGAIEAIEIPGKKFAVGLQWHPEMLCAKQGQINDINPHYQIFKQFVTRSLG